MHLSLKLTALTALLTTVSSLALGPRAAAPFAVIVSYGLPECTKTSAGGVIASDDTDVNENNCTAIPNTALSFQGFLPEPCPAGTSGELTVYSLAGCSGQPVVERGLTPTSTACIEDAHGGKSALFVCS